MMKQAGMIAISAGVLFIAIIIMTTGFLPAIATGIAVSSGLFGAIMAYNLT